MHLPIFLTIVASAWAHVVQCPPTALARYECFVWRRWFDTPGLGSNDWPFVVFRTTLRRPSAL